MSKKLVCLAIALQGLAFIDLLDGEGLSWRAAFVGIVLLLLFLLFRKRSKTSISPVSPVPSALPGGSGSIPVEKPHKHPTEPAPLPEDSSDVSAALSGYFERYLKDVVEKKHGQAAAERTRSDVEDLLGNTKEGAEKKVGRINEILGNDKDQGNRRAKGLVVGRVQSGKTQNFTGLITKAIDNDWRVILILTSNNTALKGQTVARLKNDLRESGLDYTQRHYELIDGFCDQIPCVDQQGITIGIALKEKNHLKGVSKWLTENAKALSSFGVLVIDDEADNATQNSSVGEDVWSDETVRKYALELMGDRDDWRNRRVGEWLENVVDGRVVCTFTDQQKYEIEGCVGERWQLGNGLNVARRIIEDYGEVLHINENVRGEAANCIPQPLSACVENCFCGRAERPGNWLNDFRSIMRWLLDVRRERSVINQAICDIVDNNFAKLAYVGYTATPYANFLNERRGADNPLELDFAQSMQLSPEYFGLAKIFGEDETDNARMPIVHEVAEDTNDAIYNLNHSDHESPLEVAIQWAFCCAALRRASRMGQEIADNDFSKRDRLVTTMLINVSRKQNDHRTQAETIVEYLKSKLKDREAKVSFRKSCLSTFDLLSKDFNAEQFKTEFAYEIEQGVFADVCDLSRQKVEQNIDYLFGNFKVKVLNSDVENQSVYAEYTEGDLNGDCLWIIIGGNRISRGLTFYGLIATYFDRESPSLTVETLTQMGRWFGYRPGYELMPRVWMPQGSVRTLKEICRLEEDLHTQIGQMFAAGDSRPNPLMKSISMRLTGRDAGAERMRGVENPITTNELYSDNGRAEQSVAAVRRFVMNLGQEWLREDGDGNDRVYAQLHRWHGVPFQTINDNLIKPMKKLLPESSVERLRRAVEAINSNDWNVVLADPRNREPEVQLGNISVHINGASEWGSVAPNTVRFGKFTGQYDAWRAIAPVRCVQEVEEEFGLRANMQEAWNLLFEKMARDENCAVDAQRPILQVGFLPIGNEKKPSAYISIFWPRHEEICFETIRAGNVVDNATESPLSTRGAFEVPPDPVTEDSPASQVEQSNGVGGEPRIRVDTNHAAGNDGVGDEILNEAAQAIAKHLKKHPSDGKENTWSASNLFDKAIPRDTKLRTQLNNDFKQVMPMYDTPNNGNRVKKERLERYGVKCVCVNTRRGGGRLRFTFMQGQ